MAGSTPNENILKAIDEIIKALNDLSSEIIGDNIEALRTTYETRSVAETVAQNTNFADLIAAIGQLSLVCKPTIRIINQCGGCGGGTGGTSGGTKTEDPPVSATDPPPEGQEPDFSIVNRKCKAANLIYDRVRTCLVELNKAGVDWLQTLGVATTLGLIGAIVGLYLGPIGVILGALTGILTAILGGADIEKILSAMDNRHQDLVCALYSASDTTQARDDFLNILQEEGAIWNLGELELKFVSYFFVNDILKLLFQAVPGVISEDDLENYQTAVSCGGLTDGTYYYPSAFYHFTNETNFLWGPDTLSTFSDSGAVAVSNPEAGTGLPDEVGAEFDFISGSYTTYLYMADMGAGLVGPGALTVSVRVYVPHIGFFRNPQLWTSADGLTWIRAGGGGIGWDWNSQEGDWVWSIPVGAHSSYMPLRYVGLRFEPPWGYGAPGYPHGFVDTFRVEGAESGGCGEG